MVNTFFLLLSCFNVSQTKIIDSIKFHNTICQIVDSLNDHLLNGGDLTFSSYEIESFRLIKDENNRDNLVLDFEGSSGIIIISENNNIVLYKQRGDSEDVRQSKNLYLYQNELFAEEKRIDFQDDDFFGNVSCSSNSPLDSSPIEYGDLETYISSKYYGLDFSLDESKRLQSYSASSAMSLGYHQFTESVYKKWNNDTQSYFSEGNCTLVALSNAIAYSSEFGYRNNFPSRNSSTQIITNLDVVRPDALAQGYVDIANTRDLHTIYKYVRDFAIYNPSEHYIVDGYSPNGANYVFNRMCDSFDYEPIFSYSETYSSYHFFDETHLSHPTQLYVYNDDCYNNHAMMVTGAKRYTALVNLGIMNVEYYITMVSVYDGWSTTERWYDLNYLSNMPTTYHRATKQSVAFIEIIEPDED